MLGKATLGIRSGTLSLSALLIVLFWSSPAQAASPVLSNITPRGGQRGTEAVINFNGARLTDAKEIFVYYPGITVTKLQVANVDYELATLESEGLLLQGRYREGATETEWCERTLLARIHRLRDSSHGVLVGRDCHRDVAKPNP